MAKFRPYLWILLSFVGVLTFSITYLFVSISDEINTKEEFGELQSISDDPDSTPTKPTIISKDGMNFFFIPNNTSGPQLWILLHPNSDPYYKQMPEGSYAISQEDYQKVRASGLASSTVLTVLSSHIK